MARYRYLGLIFRAVIPLLLAGCSSTPSRQASSGGAVAKPSSSGDSAKSQEVQKKTVEAYAHYLQALIYDMDEKPDEALAEFTQAALNDPGNEDLVLELTRRQIQKHQLDQALAVLTRATSVPGASGEIYARLGLVYSQLGKIQQAVEASQTAIKRSPSSLTGYRVLFLIDLQRGQPGASEKVLDQAAKITDADAEFYTGLAELYSNLLRQAPSLKASITSNALPMLNRAAKLDSLNAASRLKLGDGFYALGDTTNAAKVYLGLIKDGSSDLPLFRNEVRLKMAQIYLQDQDTTNAAAQLKAIAEEDPGNSQVYYLLGRLAYDDRRLPDAEDYFHKTLMLSDDNQDAFYKLAEVQISLQHPAEALDTLRKERVKFGDGFVVEYLMALASVAEKDYTNAVNAFTGAEVIAKAADPKLLSGEFYFDAGAAYERKGDYEQAEKYFDKSLELSPNSAEALNYLGYMLADRNVKLDKARLLIEKAVKMKPESAAYMDSLGWVLYRLKKPQEALERIQEAIKLSEEVDPTIYDHLGDIYAALNEKDKAVDAWRKSLAVEPNDEIKKKVERSTKGKTP